MPDAHGRARDRGHDRQPLGRVVQRETEHEHEAQRYVAHRIGRADGEPFAQVVQADASGNQIGERELRRARGAGRIAGFCAVFPRKQLLLQRREHKDASDPAQSHQADTLEHAGDVFGDLEAFLHGVDAKENEQTDGEEEKEIEQSVGRALERRKPNQPDRDRDHADVDPQHGEDPKIARGGPRRLHRHFDFLLEGEARGGQEHHRMGFALDPGIGDEDRGAAEARNLARRLDFVAPERIVHEHLGDGHRLGAAVDDLDRDALGSEDQALDRELLDRRKGGLEEGGRVVNLERQEHRAQEQDREDRDDQGGNARALLIRRHLPPRRGPSIPARRTRSDGRETCNGPDGGSASRAQPARPPRARRCR